MPAPILTASDLAIIAREHVAGNSDAAIGAMLDPPVERSTVRKARGRRAMQPLIKKEHRLKLDREKSARYRERKAERERLAADIERGAGPPIPATSLARRPPYGQSYPYITEGGIFHGSNIGSGRFATRGDYLRNGWKLPDGFEDDPGFGQPGFPREQLGHVRPDQYLVSLAPPPGSRDDEIGLKIRTRDHAEVERRVAEGWTEEWRKR